MIELGILQHATWRRALTELGVAAVFVVPSIDAVFRFDQGAGERFDRILRALADASGYEEIASAPIVPMGHSAHASFPWNFAASNPGRTLAVLSLKGDAPRTDLTGSGRPNPDWGSRTLDGVPGLMVMSEYEWWEARLAPLLAYRRAHPASPLLLVADAGHGHFDATDSLVDLLVLFLRKTAAARLPADGTEALRAVDPTHGWLTDRWRGDEAPRAPAAPFADYAGPRDEAFWCTDEELARAIESHYVTSRGRQRSQVGWLQGGALLPLTNSHAGVELDFLPEADGVTFKLGAEWVVPLPPSPPVATKDKRPEPVSIVPTRAAPGAHAVGPIRFAVVSGPVVPVAEGVFQIEIDRMVVPSDPRTREAWFVAHHPGDATYKGAVQQARLRLPRWAEGAEQVITFPVLRDLSVGAAPVALTATSSAGLPVRFYVREGPAVVRDGRAGVQDEGSQLVALALARAEVDGADLHWLDACAGPGGKAALLDGLAAERGARILAVEQHPHRAALVEGSLADDSASEVLVGDSRHAPWGDAMFDRVLIDAPCTGLGALRRRPESRWRRTPADLAALGGIQRDLLRAGLGATRPGGVLAYVTCSPHLGETEFVVSDVLRGRDDVVLEDARLLLPEVPDCGDGPTVQLWPQRHGTDAMFLAILRRLTS